MQINLIKFVTQLVIQFMQINNYQFFKLSFIIRLQNVYEREVYKITIVYLQFVIRAFWYEDKFYKHIKFWID